MFVVEVTYCTRLGNLGCIMTTSQSIKSRSEAEELRNILKKLPGLADANISIKNAVPPPTIDEALAAFRKVFVEYPPDPALKTNSV